MGTACNKSKLFCFLKSGRNEIYDVKKVINRSNGQNMSVPHRGSQNESELNLHVLLVVVMHQTLSQPTTTRRVGMTNVTDLPRRSGLQRGFVTYIALVSTTVTK